jgi:hypothetical protein
MGEARQVGQMSAPIREDDFFAVQVTEDLDDDRAILVVGEDHISVEFVDIDYLADIIEKLRPIEVRLSQATHDQWVAELARQGIRPCKMQ